jgi:trimeric autotransporter adhesin
MPRITTHIDSATRVTLIGSVSRLARPEFDQGEAPAGTAMKNIRLVLSRTPEQEAALERYLGELIDKSSPNYHKWLTPEEFGRLYGPADADIDALRGWLEAEGFDSVQVSKGRNGIDFSGSAGLVEQVFHTSIHTFKDGDLEFIANAAELSIPAALAPVVKGITGLDTIPDEPSLVRGPSGVYNPQTKQMERTETHPQRGGARPDYTGTLGGDPFLFITPADAATMYNTPNKTLNANFAASGSYDGTGVTIGIIGVAELESSMTTPITNWRKLFLPSNYPLKLTITNVNGTTTSDGVDETFLDIETAGGIAPGAAMHFYTSYPSILPAITQAVDDNTVDLLNVSFGKCEQTAGNTANQAILAAWQQAAAQGISVTVSSGDTGSARCDSNGGEEAYLGLAVNYYASTPFDVAVGGTDTYGLVTNFNAYVEPSSSDSSKDYYRTLLKPVPEAVWNDSQDSSTAVPGPISEAVMYNETTEAAGGGASSCSTQSVLGKCTSGWAKPAWQVALGVPNDHVRDLPDVALMSGPGYDNAGWLVCSQDLGDCATEAGGGFGFSAVGGTSAAAPTFAGMLALVEQKTGGRLGTEVNKNIYALYNNFGSRVFNDITLGNNAPPCAQPSSFLASPNCVKNSKGYYFESAYNAGRGYDEASGLGSVNATNLVEFWGEAAPSPATVTVTPSAATIFRGDSLAVKVVVSGKSGTPTGTVTLAGGGFTASAKTLADGKADFEIPANVLAVGSETLKATYSGSAKFNTATGDAKVKVTQLTPTVKVTPAAVSIKETSSLAVTVALTTAVGTPAGTVTLSSGSYKSAPATLSGGKAKVTIPADKLAVGKDTLTAAYKGGADYTAASGHTTVTVTK